MHQDVRIAAYDEQLYSPLVVLSSPVMRRVLMRQLLPVRFAVAHTSVAHPAPRPCIAGIQSREAVSGRETLELRILPPVTPCWLAQLTAAGVTWLVDGKVAPRPTRTGRGGGFLPDGELGVG